MTNRRTFLKAAAGAGVAAIAARFDVRPAHAQTPPATSVKRREVFVGRRRVKVVDVHGHFVEPSELDVVKDTNLAGNIRGNANGALVLGPQRIRAIDEQGIDVQVLSHQGGWWYGTNRDLARQLITVQNEKLAEWCKAHPDRFVGLASVALQHPDLAAEQLEEAVKRLGLRGVGIAGHVAGEVPSSPTFDPFWAKAEELDVLVFVHPGGADNVIREGAFRGRGDLGNIIGNPLETTVFFSRMIFDGALDRFPRLRFCGAHAGGYLPSYLGRTDVTCDVRANANCANKKKPRDYFKGQILADSMVFSEEGLRHLVAEMGVSQLVFGTDMPFNWPSNVDLILKAPFLNDADKEAILGGNLIKLLRLPA
jgi:aminocarboxymuconate-semialdehyde decarboxylase